MKQPPIEHRIQTKVQGRYKPDLNPGLAYLMEAIGKEELLQSKELLVGARVAFLWGMHEGIYRGKRTKTNKLNSKTNALVNGIYSEIDKHFGDLRREKANDSVSDEEE